VSAADGFLDGGQAGLERRYRRLLRLYPREFRARRETEMLGVLMASAGDGQRRPATGDVTDIVRGALLTRLRGPRGGWAPALAAFALLAPLFLVLTDLLQVAFPYWESEAGWQHRIQSFKTSSVSGTLPPAELSRWHVGGIELLSQSGFLIFALGHVAVAAAVLAGRRRMALTAMVAATAVDIALCYGIGAGALSGLVRIPMAYGIVGTGALFGFVWIPYPVAFGTIMVFLLEAVALAAAGPRAGGLRDGWRPAIPLLVLAVAVQTWLFAFEAMQFGQVEDGSSGSTDLAIGFALAAIALLLPLALGLGWRAGLLLAAACYPFALSLTYAYVWTLDGDRLPWARLVRTILTTLPEKPTLLTLLFLPPMLVVCWAAAKTRHGTRSPSGGETAA
jgi:hypothetical protein